MMPKLTQPDRVVVIFFTIGLVLGTLVALFLPYGAGFDEPEHLARVIDISQNHLMPNRGGPKGNATLADKVLFDSSYQKNFIQVPAATIFDAGSQQTRLNNGEDPTLYGYRTRAVYSWVAYAPQALAARLVWGWANAPFLSGVVLVRLAGLALYLVLAGAAIWLFSGPRWVLATLALAPTNLLQAASINADGFSNGASLLFFSICLALLSQPQVKKPWAWLAGLVVAMLLVASAKPGIAIIFLFALPLFWQPGLHRHHKSSLLAGLLTAVLLSLFWVLSGVQNSHFTGGGSQNLSESLRLILKAPLAFGLEFARSLALSALGNLQESIAVFGYWAGEIHPLTAISYLLALACLLVAAQPPRGFTPRLRWLMLSVFAVSAVATLGMFFVANYHTIGHTDIGRNGRYLLPFVPYLWVPLAGLWQVGQPARRWLAGAATALLLFCALSVAAAFATTYYSYCDLSAYLGAQCKIPTYKNFDDDDVTLLAIGNSQIEFGFTTQCDELERIDLYLSGHSPASQVAVTLAQGSAAAGSLLWQGVLTPGNASYISILPPQPLPRLARVGLLIQNPAGEGDPLAVGLIKKQFPTTHLRVDGKDIDGHLHFRYFCAQP